MRCSEVRSRAGGRGAPQSARRARARCAVPASPAHKASDSYLQIDGRAGRGSTCAGTSPCAISTSPSTSTPTPTASSPGARCAPPGRASRRTRCGGWRSTAARCGAVGRGLERRNDGAYAVLLPALDRARCRRRRAIALFALRRGRSDPSRHRQGPAAGQAGRAVGARSDRDAGSAACRARRRARGATLGRASGRMRAEASRRAGSSSSKASATSSTGYDHVLFLLCLLLPSVMRRTTARVAAGRAARRRRCCRWSASSPRSRSRTRSRSALAALKLVSLPSAFIEPAIAVTIVLAALDNVWPIFPVRRVVVTFCFGLIHGFGFASVLAELNLPTRRLRLGAAAVQPRPRGRASW